MIYKILLISSILLLTACGSRPKAEDVASKPPERTFLGKSETGYEMWTDGSCVFVKGIKNSDFQRLNTTLDGFKQSVKQTTGKQCVIFE
jgi:hypothetical protein